MKTEGRWPYPRPGITRDNQFFWDGLAQEKLLIQRCVSCRRLQHPPAPMCAGCHGLEMDSIEASGRGVVHSFVVAEHPPIPPFAYPNLIGLVELEEGTRLVTQLVGIEPGDVRIGMPVRVEFERVEPDYVLHRFRPVSA